MNEILGVAVSIGCLFPAMVYTNWVSTLGLADESTSYFDV